MKKKFFNSFITLALCGIVGFSGLSFKNDTSEVVAESSENHVRRITETNDYIVKNGKTDYKVVLPQNCSATITTAAEELSSFFYEATGIYLPVIDDSQVSEITQDSQYISLGKTTLLKSSPIYSSVTYDALGSDGYRLATEGKTVFLSGYGDYGTLFSVYDLLGDLFHYEFFFTDIYTLDTGVMEVKLRNYDIKEKPDIPKRMNGYGYQVNNPQTTNRQRLRRWTDYFIPVNGRMWHNTTSGYIPYDLYEEEHPSWYGTGKGRIQMCYTARGDKAEYEALIDHLAQTIVSLLEQNPDKSLITITQEDYPYWCSCDACEAEKAKYGASSAAVVKLCVKVADRVGEIWRSKNDGKERENGYEIAYFAYGETIAPPQKNFDEVDENGKSVFKHDHVLAFFASTSIDSTQSLYAPINQQFKDYLETWRGVTDRFLWWTYHDNQRQYLVPYNGIDTIAEYAKYMKEIGVDLWFPQTEYNQSGASTGWAILFGYLQANLAWNVDSDVGAMTERFFKVVYKDAAEDMMALYNETRVWLQYMGDQGWYSGLRSIFNETHKKAEYWPRELLQNWLTYTENAMNKISYLKDSAPKAYTNTYKAIATERIYVEYLLYDLHRNDLKTANLTKLKAQLKDDILVVGMSHFWELQEMPDFLNILSEK